MRDRRALEVHLEHHLAGILGRLFDGARNFVCLAVADADVAATITGDNQRAEAERATTLHDLRAAIYTDDRRLNTGLFAATIAPATAATTTTATLATALSAATTPAAVLSAALGLLLLLRRRCAFRLRSAFRARLRLCAFSGLRSGRGLLLFGILIRFFSHSFLESSRFS
jgi:hypothetical protein